MRHTLWSALRALILTASLAALLAGCALTGSPTVNKPGAALPAVLVSSLAQSPQGSMGFSTLHIQALDPSDGSVRWSYEASRHPWHRASAPVVANGIVYATSDTLPANPATHQLTGDLTALSERDGHTLWTVHIGWMASTPVVADGVVYVSALGPDAKRQVTSFYALRADTGRQIWRTDITDTHTSYDDLAQGFGSFDDIQLVNGALYVTSNRLCETNCDAAYLLALRASDSKQLWKVTLSNLINTIQPPTIADGALYVMLPGSYVESISPAGSSEVAAGSALAAYSASDGALRWKVPIGPGAPVDVVGDTVYATSTVKDDPSSPDSTFTISVKALDAATGATRWRFTASTHGTDTLLSLLGATSDTVYVQSRSGGAYTISSLNPRDGSVRWHTPLQAPLGSQLLNGAPLYGITGALAQQASDRAYANVVALDPTSGHALWSAPLTPTPRGDIPAVVLAPSGGALYAVYFSNALSAINTQGDHATLWTATAPGWLAGVTVVS